jgi:hypothetical protein
VTADALASSRVNPFSTRFVRPGAIPYQFAAHETAAATIDRFARLAWQAQILGPHGAGKSTLVAALAEPLRAAGRAPCVLALHDGQRRLPAGWTAQARRHGAGTIVIDGYEQLGRPSRWWLRRACRREGWALLVTAHHDVGLPTLMRVVPDVSTARAVVEFLLQGRRDAQAVISRRLLEGVFHACGGNVREMLFALYDRYEDARAAHAAGRVD